MEVTLRNMTSIYLLKEDRVLLLYRQGGRVVNEVWTGSAGGHFEPEELNHPKHCVFRELKEELGLEEKDVDECTLRYITLRNIKGEIRQNYYYFAELKDSVGENLTSNEGISRWFSLNEILSLDMPYTAGYVMEHYCKTGQYTNDLYVGVANENGVIFSKMEKFLIICE